MLRPLDPRGIALALLQLLPARLRPAVHRQLARLRHLIFPMTRRQLGMIRASGLWDPEWYAQQVDESIEFASHDDGLLHFVRDGGLLGLSPHPLFDSAWYLEQNPDVAALRINPLFHYLSSGHREGRSPNPLFSDHWYREHNPDVADFAAAALQHYLQFGDREGRDPHPLLKNRWYRNQWDEPAVEKNALADYLHQGERSGLKPNRWFDPAYYEAQRRGRWPEQPAPPNLLAHFVTAGSGEGLDPSAEFSLFEYCEQHPEVAESGENPLIHFLNSGRASAARQQRPPLEAREWVEIFGSLTSHEHALLKAHFDAHGQGRILVLHPADAGPTIRRSVMGKLQFDCRASTDAASASGYDAVVLCDRPAELREDALQLGLTWLRTTTNQALYFDELVTPQNAAPHLNFKPDWSPALHAAGRLDIPVLMLTPELWETLPPDSTSFGTQLASLAPTHLPLIGASVPPAAHRASISDTATANALVSIIIPTRDQLDYLRACVDSIFRQTDYPDWEILIVDNGSEEPRTRDWLREIAKDPRVRVKAWPKPFNFSEVCNVGVAEARGELVCLLNNDVEITQADWLQKLASAAMADDCGAAGALLLYPDGRIQSGGVLMGPGGVAANRFATVHPSQVPEGLLDTPHEVSAVAGACLVTRKSLYQQLGGLNQEQLGVAFNDVDYCLRIRELGFYCRLEPRVRLIHHESISLKDHARGRSKDFAAEVQWMQQRWAKPIARDPFHNLNLRLSKFNPLRPYPGNRRALLWPELGLKLHQPPSPAGNHPPLQWYVDDNQQRVEEVRAAKRTLQLQHAADTDGLAILILTKDRPEYIIPLLEQLTSAKPAFDAQQLAFRVYIGDTGSTDRQVLDCYRQLPDCCELVTGLDYQFSRCNNQLLERAQRFRSVLFLNNDISFKDAASSLEMLYSTLQAKSETGIVGAVLSFPDGTVQHEGIAAFPQGPLRGFVHHPGAHEPGTLRHGETRTCLAVTGALLMARAAALRVSGGFDEAYAAECQDVDLCLAAARGGYSSVLQHAGHIVHFENGTRERGEESWADRRRLMRRWSNWIEENWL